MKLYTVVPIIRGTEKEMPPRYDLAPMNHAAACNFMEACRNSHSDYRIHDWPADVAHPALPMYATGYRSDQSPIAWEEALEARDELDARVTAASATLHAKYPEKGPMGLTPDHVKVTPEWKADRLAYDRAARAMGDYNRGFLKRFKREWKAELLKRRQAKAGLAAS